MRNAVTTSFILTGTLAAAGASHAGLVSTWIGPATGNWNVAGNWNNGVPGTAGVTDAVIPAARMPITVTMNTSPSIQSLTLGLGATLLQPNSEDLTFTSLLNDGLWTITSTGSYTEVKLAAPSVAFAGSGAVSLSGTLARIVGTGSVRELVNEANHTIAGWGQLGDNEYLRLANLGVVSANASGHVLRIDPAADTTNINGGLLEATGGGTLELYTLILDNSGGTIRAEDASVVRLMAGTSVQGGILQSDGTGFVRTADGNQSIVDVHNEGALRLLNADDLNVYGTTVNDGTISLESTGSFTGLRIDSLDGTQTTFSGSGQLLLGSLAYNQVTAINGPHILVNGPLHTIAGGGELGSDSALNITNQGVVDANLAGVTMVVDAAPSANTGLMRARNGGSLSLLTLDLDNTGGVLRAEDASNVRINASAIRGGTLETIGTGYIHSADGSQSVVGIHNLGALRLLNAEDLNLYGTIENDGSITLESNGSYTELRIDTADGAPTTFLGGGEVVLGGLAYNRIVAINGSRTLVNGPDHTIRGGGDFGGNTPLGITNLGLIAADKAGKVLDIDAAPSINQGVMKASDGGTLQLTTVELDNAGGVLRAEDGSQVRVLASSIWGGTLASEGTGYVHTSDGNQALISVHNQAALRLLNAEDINIYGTLLNDGSISIESAGSFTEIRVDSLDGSPTTLAGSGELVLGTLGYNRIIGINGVRRLVNGMDHTIRGGGSLGANANLDLTNQGSILADHGTMEIDVTNDFLNDGTLRVTGDGALQLHAGTFVNRGTFQVDAGRSASRTGTLNQQDGVTRVDGSLTIGSSGSLGVTGGLFAGDGTVTGPVVVSGGSSAPSNADGGPLGSLLVNGAYTQSADGGYLVDLGLAGNDLLTVNGTATLGGALQIRLVDEFVPVVGQQFTILTATAITGVFECVEYPQGAAGYFHVVYGPHEVKLVVDILPPQEADLDFNGSVGASDLAILLGNWGEQPCDNAICCPSDLNGDGKVNASDLAILLGGWG